MRSRAFGFHPYRNSLGRLGDDQSDATASLLNLSAQFRLANQQLIEFGSLVQQLNQQNIINSQNGGDPDPDIAGLGQALLQRRFEYEDLLAKYQDLYRTAFGTTVPGLSGLPRLRLGVVPVFVAWAGVALAAAAIAAGLYAWIQRISVDKQNAQNKAAQIANQSSLVNQAGQLDLQAARARAAGDLALAQQLQLAANQTRGYAVDPNLAPKPDSPLSQIPWGTIALVGGLAYGAKLLLG